VPKAKHKNQKPENPNPNQKPKNPKPKTQNQKPKPKTKTEKQNTKPKTKNPKTQKPKPKNPKPKTQKPTTRAKEEKGEASLDIYSSSCSAQLTCVRLHFSKKQQSRWRGVCLDMVKADKCLLTFLKKTTVKMPMRLPRHCIF
jgi:DNA mismatch repair ATPase MutL